MKGKPVLLFAALFLSGPVAGLNAQTASRAAAFLEIDGGARGAALGGAFTAVANDASSVFYNPAGPALLAKPELMVSHSQWLEDLWNEHAAYVHPVSERLTFFTAASGLFGQPLDKYDAAGAQSGTFTAFDGAFGAGAAAALSGSLYAGVNLKAVYSRADQEKALAYAADLGLLQTRGRLRLGLALQNVGTKMKLYRKSFDLPRISRAGAAFHFADRYRLSAEGITAGGGGTIFAGGLEGEYVTREYTGSMRLGYKAGRSKNTGNGFSAGLGYKSGEISGDYAYSPFGEFGDTHRLTINYRFGKKRNKAARAGTKAASRKIKSGTGRF